MPRNTVLGNGNMLVNFDIDGYVRDIYYPRAGFENHVVGQYHRIGISIDNNFYWLSQFERTSEQSANSLATIHNYHNEQEQIDLKIESVVYNEKPILVRNVKIINHKNATRDIRIFFNQEFKIKENKYRNTAYYYPPKNVVIHYRGRRVFLINIISDTGGINDYTIGLYDYEGKLGSYLAAKKIELPKNSVEHGPVDSVVAKRIEVASKESKEINYIIIAAKNVEEALKENDLLFSEKNPEHILKTTNNYWTAWKNKREFHFFDLDQELIKIFYQSLFVVKAHIDQKDGGIIASSDSTMYMYGKDSYAYVWPRDAGYIGKAMLKAGYFSDARKVLDFFSNTISSKGYMMHKFELDKSLGSSWHSWINNGEFEIPIQEDETSMVIHLLYEYFYITRDIEYIEEHEEELLERPARFLIEFVNKYISLPLKSYDIWEEKYRTYTYTTCTVIDALEKAAKLSEILGKTEKCKSYKEQAKKMRAAIKTHLYNKEEKIFYRSIMVEEKEIVDIDKKIDASTLFGLWYYKIFDAKSTEINDFQNRVTEVLKDKNGYYTRYEDDWYFRKEGQSSNPWLITTLWNIQLNIAKAANKKDLLECNKQLIDFKKLIQTSGIMPEQVDPISLDAESATPLIWSHACFIETIIAYMQKAELIMNTESNLPKQ